MAPLVLKLDRVSNLFDDLTVDPDELFDTWRICTKAKKALEHGSRLENISWRRWYLHGQRKTQEKAQESASVLERQYKRNLLLQQKKQCEQALQATKPAVFVDNQYQPPPTLTSTSTTSTCSSNSSFTLDDDTLMTCLSYPVPLSDSYIHPAMYVASDEPFVPPPSTNYSVDPTHTSLASYLTTTLHHETIRTKKKAKKVRVRCPLPVINGKDSSVCDDCGTHSTPLWRRYQNRNLCNACGLYWKLHNSPRPIHLIPSKEDPNNPVPCCTNCGTMTTPLWRRNEIDGSPLCNACGLYAKLHQETRPLSMKTNTIKKRQRLS